MKRRVIWASAHTPTPQQIEELKEMGEVVFLRDENPELFEKITKIPVTATRSDLIALAKELDSFVRDALLVQPAGSPVFHMILGAVRGGTHESELTIFAINERISKDIPQPDGSVKKVSIFKHKGWI